MDTAKKGKVSWRPANILRVANVPGYRVRWCSTDPTRLRKHLAEGWIPATDIPVNIEIEQDSESSLKRINGVTEYRELALLCLPEELGQARDEYIEELTNDQSITPANRARSALPETKDFIFDDEESLRRY